VLRNSAETRARIVEAATAEFAQFGCAGGRIDRIAARAQVNKQLIYAHFQDKHALFDHVAQLAAASLAATTPAAVLEPGLSLIRLCTSRAARIRYRPEHIRLLLWQALEADPAWPGGV
jgi:AcrR family transcriptional regulator